MKNAWDIAPFLQEEGTFTGKVLRIRSLETIGGAQILIRLDDAELPESPDHTADLEKLETRLKVASTDNADEILTAIQRLMNIEQKEIQDGTGSVKIAIFYDGWKYTDDTGNSYEMDIELLIRQLTPGTHITFRTSKIGVTTKSTVATLKISPPALTLDTKKKQSGRKKTVHMTL